MLPPTAPRVPFLTLLLTALLALPVAAVEDQDASTPTAWQWFHGQSVSDVANTVADGYRLVDLEVESVSPKRFSAAYVHNSGSYAKTWWWYDHIDLTTLGNLLAQNTARLIDIEPYDAGGATRYAAVMVRNTGADAKGWWYWTSTNLSTISGLVSQNDARVVDLEETVVAGQTWYTVVAISNTGADDKEWYWWIGASVGFLSGEIAAKDLRIVDLEQRSNGTYNAVLVKNTEAMHWWWYVNQSEASLSALIAQTGSRVQSLHKVGSLFHAVLHNNSNALTTRIGDILRDGTDGVGGLYLKEIGGSVRANLQEHFAFEPASTIKTLMHVHAMKQVTDGNASLGELLTVFTGSIGSCPQYTGPISEDLGTVLRLMMEDSDNNRTLAVRDRFGLANINATATGFGMTQTGIIHTLGCGGPPPNTMSLYDGGLLHERVAGGHLGSQKDTFYDLMLNSVTGYGNGRLGTIIDEEGAALGLSDFVLDDFRSQMAMAYKGGSYGYGFPLDYYWSVLAWVKIPFLSGNSIVEKQYVTGVFVHDASVEAQAASTTDEAAAELLRDEIRAALQSWASYSSWVSLGGGVTGNQPMLLSGDGSLVGGTQATTILTGALPHSAASLVLGLSYLGGAFKGGVWGPFPDVLTIGVPIGGSGSISLPTTWPTGLPSGFAFWVQWWQVDPAAPVGYAGSNTLRGSTP